MTAHSDVVDDSGTSLPLRFVPLEDKVRVLTGADAWSTHPLDAVGLGRMVLSDGPVGPRGPVFGGGADQQPSLLFPSPSAVAATWDDEASRAAGALMGAKARELGVHVLLAPTVNLHRSPLGGRHFECYSEDPLLTARIAARFIEGVQSTGVAATVKHFVGNDSETERMTYDARITEKALREVYLLPFEAAVREARVWAVMAAYNGVNGESMCDNRRLLTSVLKEEWGFDGVVVSDWNAARTAAASALAGLDLVMPDHESPWGKPLIDAVRAGEVPEDVVDDKVARLFRLARRTGAVAGRAPQPVDTAVPADYRDQLRRLAVNGSVLLRNSGALPLSPAHLSKVALIGPNATRFTVQGGGSANVTPEHETTLPEALGRVLGEGVELPVTAGVFTHSVRDVLPEGRAVNPVTGDPGVAIELVDAGGAHLAYDHRPVEPWHFPVLMPDGTAEIILRTRLTLAKDGLHRIAVLGAGELTTVIDGVERASVTQRLPEPDFAALLMDTPTTTVPFTAPPGEVELTLRLRPQEDFSYPVALIGVRYEPPRRADADEWAAAIAAAREADAVVLVVGTSDEFERENIDRTTLVLPGRQDELVEAVCAANPNTVVVVNAGAPVLMPWVDRPAAVLWAWFPGQEGADAVADVLTGTEPGGRLPTTFPAAEADCPVPSTRPGDGVLDYAEGSVIGYRAYAAREITPRFPFGHGLSYTDWGYGDLEVIPRGTGVDVGFDVVNTGGRAGREVAQVYLESPGEPLRLVGYTPVHAEPGERTRVALHIDERGLSRWSADGWAITPGTHRIRVGRSSADLPLGADVRLP